jgi:hypothetical protein
VLYYAFIDDSADRNRDRVVVAGAIIGEKKTWNALNKSWRDRLDIDGIGYFKSSHCETLNGQFHKFRALGMEDGKRKALAVRNDLHTIIRNSPLTALGVTLSVPFHKVMYADPAKFGAVPSLPYRLAFQQVIAECGKAMQLLGRENIVTFGHDDTDEFPILHQLYKNFKKLNPRYSGVLADFVRLDDKTRPPVQAADVSAWATYHFANDYLNDPSGKNMRHLRQNMYKIVNWLDNAQPCTGRSGEDAPAHATYAA